MPSYQALKEDLTFYDTGGGRACGIHGNVHIGDIFLEGEISVDSLVAIFEHCNGVESLHHSRYYCNALLIGVIYLWGVIQYHTSANNCLSTLAVKDVDINSAFRPLARGKGG